MERKFTLIEMIISIVVLGILASIVIANVSDMKKDSIRTAVESNTRILQTAVDTYALKNNNQYPVDKEITLTSPQYINIDLLYPKYIKSELDYKRIKEQYYWVDVFGKVWGSTKDAALDITETNDTLEWSIPKGVEGYALYEIKENNATGAVFNKTVKLVNQKVLPSNKNKVQIPLENGDSMYLMSTIDEYGLEAAPVGLNYGGKGQFAPIFRGNGEYEFELSNLETMYWEKFWTIEDKPEGTSITYQFSILKEDGTYGDWVDDFYSLDPSKGLKIKITMKAFENKYPSIYDIRVMYRYKDDPKPEYPQVSIDVPEGGWTMDSWAPFPTISTGGGRQQQSGGQEGSTGGTSGGTTDSPIVCGPGGTVTNIDRTGRILDGGYEAYVTYSFVLPKGQYLSNIKIPDPNVEFNHYVRGMWLEYSKNQNPYVKAKSMSEVPDESCVKVVYNLMQVDNFMFPPLLFPPSITTVSEQPKVLVDPPSYWSVPGSTPKPAGPVGGVPSKPEPTDTVVLDSKWETINTLRFFAHSGDGQITHWVSATMNDVQPANTRIVYRYATSNGYYWSNQVDSISKVSDSRSLVVVAYLQIHKDYISDPAQQEPLVNSIRIVHERGAVDLDTVKPTLAIMPVKDNNMGRDVISDASKIEWKYEAVDPRGLEIVEVEWAGDKRETYPIGMYEVKLRVRNSSNYWSDWVTYRFEVKSEKPVAAITIDNEYIEVDSKVNWQSTTSVDPDGDELTKTEWKDDYKTSYAAPGTYTLQLRVQDAEGNWSDWKERTFTVYGKALLLYRLEAEDPTNTRAYANELSTAGASNSKYLELYTQSHWTGPQQGRIEFTFIGNGINVQYYERLKADIWVDGVKVETVDKTTEQGKFGTYVLRALQQGTHKVSITQIDGSVKSYIDFIEVFGLETTPTISNVYARSISGSGVEGTSNNNSIVASQGTQSKIYYQLDRNAYMTILVKDGSGNIVRTLQSNQLETGGTNKQHFIVWDGKNNVGETVPTANYTVQLQAMGVDKKASSVSSQDFIVTLDNTKPIYRMEAEDSSLAKGNAQALDDTVASRDKVLGLYTLYHWTGPQRGSVKVTFTGTGVDVGYINKANVIINVDGKLHGTINQTLGEGQKDVYSIRGLAQGTHTVDIISQNAVASSVGVVTDYSFIDYIDVYSDVRTPVVSNVATKVLSNGLESSISNSIIVPDKSIQTKTYYTLDKDSYVTIQVKNSGGQVVKTLKSAASENGGTNNQHSVLWDGRNSSGSVVPTGTYTLDMTFEDIYKKTSAQQQVSVYVDNSNPTSKLEGEDGSITKGNAVVVDNAAFSGGKVLRLTSVSHWTGTQYGSLQFTMTGSGVDIVVADKVNAEIYVDGVSKGILKGSVETGNTFVFPIRNLTQGTHTIKIVNRDAVNQYSFFDYFHIYNN